jgi:glutathione S-transferase
MGLVAALEWLGRPYQLCRVDMLHEMRSPAYARINPRHETPVLITADGRILTETLAIAAWIQARDRDHRVSFPPLSPEADRMHQLMAFVNTGFTGAFSPLWLTMERADLDPAIVPALRQLAIARVVDRHDRLEEQIGTTTYLVGERPSLADAVLIGVARWLEFHQVADGARWPKLAALRARLERDPAVRYATALEDGERPPGTGACRRHVALAEVIERFGA